MSVLDGSIETISAFLKLKSDLMMAPQQPGRCRSVKRKKPQKAQNAALMSEGIKLTSRAVAEKARRWIREAANIFAID